MHIHARQRWRYWGTVSLIVLILGACGASQPTALPMLRASPTPLRRPTPLSPLVLSEEQQQRTSWLRGTPCRAPCWNGITPGVTTLTETLNILHSDLLVAAVTASDNPSGRAGVVEWTWRDGEPSAAGYDLTAHPYTIYEIGIPSYPLRLGDVMAVYGPPSHVIAIQQRDGPFEGHPATTTYALYVIYLDIGLLFAAEPPALMEQVDATIALITTRLAIPGRDGLAEAVAWPPAFALLVPWEGERPFAYYCRDLYTGEACTDGP